MLLVLIGLAFLSIGPPPGAAVPPHSAEFSISISDTPSPSDPFLLSFSVTVIPGSPSAFNWNFGDGHYWNGSGATYASPVHRYIDPGSFLVGVVVWEGNVSGSQALSVTVAAPGLRATIALDPPPGPSPFTATFTASISGGTGTYPTVHWSFGDGGAGSGLVIRYTYVRPGNYLASLNVTDSAGAIVATQAWVNVSTGTGAVATGAGWTTAFVLAAGTVVGTLAAIAALGLWLGRRRLAGSSENARGEETGESAVIAPTFIETSTFSGPGPTLSESPSGTSPVAAVGPAEGPPGIPAAAERLRLSQRIVLHLAGLGALGADEVAAIGFTQLGMSQALDTRQNALTNVLRRLVAAAVLVEDVRHVRGQPRRLKVYRLTTRGEGLARDLRRQRRPDRPSGTTP